MENKSKKRKVLILILIILIVFAIGIDFYLVIQSKKTNHGMNNTNEFVNKAMWCQKKSEVFTNQDIGIQYTLKEENYSFFIAENQELISDVWQMVILFDNLDDLNIYYDYLINTIKFQESGIKKDETQLTITQTLNSLQGGYKFFSTEYLDFLTKSGYTCTEI